MSKFSYGYTLEKNLCETDSLKKYFVIKQLIVNKSKLKLMLKKDTDKLLLLITSNLSLYSDCIEESKRPIIIFQFSDETYDFLQAKIYKHKNIKFIIRNYKIFSTFFLLKSLLRWPLLAIKWIYCYCIYNLKNNNISLKETIAHLIYILFSIKFILKQIIFSLFIRKVKHKLIYLPLNETNFFNLGKNKKSQKKFIISFSGSIHSSERIRSYHIAKKMGFSNGYTGWGWNSQDSLTPKKYNEMLKNSKYSLCPSGHMNLDTFRFYEIIKSGALPIIPKETPFQPFNYYSEIYDADQRIFVNLFTELNIKNVFKSISNKDYYLILKNVRNSIKEKNKKIKKLIKFYN
jgi:hypothetical protein